MKVRSQFSARFNSADRLVESQTRQTALLPCFLDVTKMWSAARGAGDGSDAGLIALRGSNEILATPPRRARFRSRH